MQQSRRRFLSHFAALGGCFMASAWPTARVAVSQPRSGGGYQFAQGVTPG